MRVGYCVAPMPALASYRLRVEIPSRHLGCDYVIGAVGKPTFFYKNGNRAIAETCTGGVVYDVVNDHFGGKFGAEYHGMCGIADVITVASEAMAETVYENTGRDAIVISDPYENDESEPKCVGNELLWFGHSANLASVLKHADAIDASGTEFVLCSNISRATVQWSPESEADCLDKAAVVLMTGTNPGASANRVVKAIRAGRFVVAPKDCADAWRELAPYIWIGDVAEGIAWALNNREEACQKISAGQVFTRDRFAPTVIGDRWTELFASI